MRAVARDMRTRRAGRHACLARGASGVKPRGSEERSQRLHVRRWSDVLWPQPAKMQTPVHAHRQLASTPAAWNGVVWKLWGNKAGGIEFLDWYRPPSDKAL